MRSIIKIGDYYSEWSTVVDAPVLQFAPLDVFKRWYKQEYGNSSMAELEIRLQRVEVTGTSAFGQTLEDTISGNRAGDDDSTLTAEEILAKYSMPGYTAKY